MISSIYKHYLRERYSRFIGYTLVDVYKNTSMGQNCFIFVFNNKDSIRNLVIFDDGRASLVDGLPAEVLIRSSIKSTLNEVKSA